MPWNKKEITSINKFYKGLLCYIIRHIITKEIEILMFTLSVTAWKLPSLPYFICSSTFNIKYICDWKLDKGYLWLNDKKKIEEEFISLKCANNQKISHMMTIMAKRIISCEWMWFRKRDPFMFWAVFCCSMAGEFLCW